MVPGGIVKQYSRSTSQHTGTTIKIPSTVIMEVKGYIDNSAIDQAVNRAVSYIKSVAKTSEDKTQLQNSFDKLAMSCGSFPFLDALANSIELQQFKPDNTPPLFQGQVGGSVLFAAADHSNTDLLETNFNQTDIDTVLSSKPLGISDAAKDSIKNTASLCGKLFDLLGNPIGGCLRISEDMVIMPLHCAINLFYSKVKFLNPDLQTYTTCNVGKVLDKYENLDIAVVQLHEKQAAVDIKFNEIVLEQEQLFLLHFPDGSEGLQVSANTCTLPTTWDEYSMVTNHDSSPCSSGGIYINKKGEVVGMHIGINREFASLFNNERYAYRFLGLSLIVEAESPLYEFLSQEGKESQKILAAKLKAKNKLTGIKTTAYGGVAFKDNNRKSLVPKLKQDFPVEFQQTVTASLGQAGLHGKTRQYSIEQEIESDHPIPCEVWRETTNIKLKQYAPGAPGTHGRPGQNKMPAMTIPENIHSKLSTTINPKFRDKLKTLCDNNKIPVALKEIIKDQKAKGLKIDNTKAGQRYKDGWITMLNEFEIMGVLTQTEKNDVVNHL